MRRRRRETVTKRVSRELCLRGSIKESHRWNWTRILALKERFETHKNVLNGSLKQHTKIYSGSYCCTAYVLFRRRLIQKLWPVVYFLFAFILEIEYVAWNNLFPKIRLQVKPVCIATTAGGLELSTLNFAVPAAAAAAESESTAIRLVVVHFAAADSDSAAAATCCSFQKRRTLPQPQTQKEPSGQSIPAITIFTKQQITMIVSFNCHQEEKHTDTAPQTRLNTIIGLHTAVESCINAT
ncbi:hypothetical protein YC2023_006794 [Brassica napus]